MTTDNPHYLERPRCGSSCLGSDLLKWSHGGYGAIRGFTGDLLARNELAELPA